MGGTGDSGYDLPKPSRPDPGGGSGGGPQPDDPCARLVFPAFVSSPDPAVVGGLAVGDVLDVMLTESAGVPLVELHATDGRTAGTLTTNLARLLPCLDIRAFAAEVTSVTGGAVEVQVRPA